MAGFFKRLLGGAEDKTSHPLCFKDGTAALQYACQFLHAELREGSVLPALVLDAKVELGAEEQVVRMPDGTQMAALRVCSRDGGFIVLAGTLSANGPALRPGDLVAWSAGKAIERETYQLKVDPRSSWVGIVLAKLKPEYAINRGWAISEPFRQ